MDSKIQFVNRIHLLHPHEYEKFKNHLVCKNIWRGDISIDSLQSQPDVTQLGLVRPELRFCSVENPADEFLSYQQFLVNACKRHKDFINKASLINLYEDEKKAERLILNYKKFLYLKMLHPDAFLVPTIGTDLVWHTHLLDHENYKKETATLFGGKFMNHTDDVEEESTKFQFQKTMEFWKDAFGEVPTKKADKKKIKDKGNSNRDGTSGGCGAYLHSRNQSSEQSVESETTSLSSGGDSVDSIVYEAHDDFGQCDAVCIGIADNAGCGTGYGVSGSSCGSSGGSSSCGSGCGGD